MDVMAMALKVVVRALELLSRSCVHVYDTDADIVAVQSYGLACTMDPQLTRMVRTKWESCQGVGDVSSAWHMVVGVTPPFAVACGLWVVDCALWIVDCGLCGRLAVCQESFMFTGCLVWCVWCGVGFVCWFWSHSLRGRSERDVQQSGGSTAHMANRAVLSHHVREGR